MSTKDQNSRHVTNKVSQRGVGSEKEVVNMKPALRVHTGAKPSCSQLYFITKGWTDKIGPWWSRISLNIP